MGNSLVKFTSRTHSNGKRVFWDRAEVDGLPYRGTAAPYFREDEFEQRVVRVADSHNGFFDTTDPQQNQAFLDIIDGCMSGWYQCLFIQRFWNNTSQHYIEWVEYFLEDGSPVRYAQQGVMEMRNGS